MKRSALAQTQKKSLKVLYKKHTQTPPQDLLSQKPTHTMVQNLKDQRRQKTKQLHHKGKVKKTSSSCQKTTPRTAAASNKYSTCQKRHWSSPQKPTINPYFSHNSSKCCHPKLTAEYWQISASDGPNVPEYIICKLHNQLQNVNKGQYLSLKKKNFFLICRIKEMSKIHQNNLNCFTSKNAKQQISNFGHTPFTFEENKISSATKVSVHQKMHFFFIFSLLCRVTQHNFWQGLMQQNNLDLLFSCSNRQFKNKASNNKASNDKASKLQILYLLVWHPPQKVSFFAVQQTNRSRSVKFYALLSFFFSAFHCVYFSLGGIGGP